MKMLIIVIFSMLAFCVVAHAANPVEPDAVSTPGAADHHVTQSNIHQSICLHGYIAKEAQLILNRRKRGD